MDINIDLRDCIKFDNTYHFKLIRDGKIIQEETTHNIVCKALNSSGNFSFFGRNNEEEDWNEIISFNHNVSEASFLTFEEVNYRYYKVSTDQSSTVFYNKTNYVNSEQQVKPSCIFKNEDLCMFGYKGRCIIFTNPPAAGSVITMSADTDLPMKNNNFVLDFAITLQF